MRKFLLPLLLASCLASFGQTLRGPVTTTTFTRSLMLSETSEAFLNTLGIAVGNTNVFETTQFDISGSATTLKNGALATNFNFYSGWFVSGLVGFTNGAVMVDTNTVITNNLGQEFNFKAVSNANTIATLSGVSNIVGALGVGGTGTVTSVGLTMPSVLFNNPVAGSPVTTSGVLAPVLGNQTANLFFAGPGSGSPAAPTFRAIALADLPGSLTNTVTGSVSLTADNQVVGASTNAVLLIASDSGTASSRTFVLTTGVDGKRLTLVWSGTNAGELVDDSANSGSGNVRLASTWTPTQYDSITLVAVGADWYESGRSAN